MCCSVLQCAAVCAVFSSVELTYFANYLEQKLDNDCDGMCVCGSERKPRVCCSVLQCAAACGSVELTYFARYLQRKLGIDCECVYVCEGEGEGLWESQRVAVCCSSVCVSRDVKCVAVCCSVLQCVAVCCSGRCVCGHVRLWVGVRRSL